MSIALSEQEILRRKSLQELRDLGINPYPAEAFNVTAWAKDITENFEANPETYTELKRQDVLDGKVWSYPVLAYDHLFARSTKEGVCLELK